MSYHLFLDDERFPPNDGHEWEIVRNYDDFVSHITRHGLPKMISFDHDLGILSLTGYDCAKWLTDYCMDHKLSPDYEFYVHSQNPVGKINSEGLLNQFKLVSNLFG